MIEDDRFHWWTWLRRGGLLLVTVVVIEYVVLPQLIGARDDVSLLASAEPWLLVAALVLEVGSWLCFSAVSIASLPVADRPSYGRLLRIDLSGLGFSHVVPGGGAAAAAFRYRLLTRAGVGRQDAMTGTTIETAAALVVLVGVFLVGIALSLSSAHQQPAYLTAGAVAGVVLVVLLTGVLLLTWRRTQTLAVVHRVAARLPRTPAAQQVEGTLGELGTRLEGLLDDHRLLTRTLLWTTAYWMLDAGSLWLCLKAYGYSESTGPLLALYGAVTLLAMIPTTPGGLGIVEGVLVPGLVSVGTPAAVALLGVITWRLLQYWLPIPVAAATYLSLRMSKPRQDQREIAVPPVTPLRSTAGSEADRP